MRRVFSLSRNIRKVRKAITWQIELTKLTLFRTLIRTTFYFSLLSKSSIEMTWAEVIPDAVLASFYSYLLLRIATSSDAYFKKPFYTFFIATGVRSFVFIRKISCNSGVYSIASIVSFLCVFQFAYSENCWTVYIYKIAFVTF